MCCKETGTSPEGMVKNHFSFRKNPSQHAADFKFLKTTQEFKNDSTNKPVDCIRVDGATDERPSILEVQFLWTEVHLVEEKICTCLAARNSGGSFLNRVELVNGCIARAHSNIFIPCTLNGSDFNEDGLNKKKLKENLEAATEVYIDIVQDAPFGKTTIKFFKGANDENATYLQKRREKLLKFLHGSKSAKQELKKETQYFTDIAKRCGRLELITKLRGFQSNMSSFCMLATSLTAYTQCAKKAFHLRVQSGMMMVQVSVAILKCT